MNRVYEITCRVTVMVIAPNQAEAEELANDHVGVCEGAPNNDRRSVSFVCCEVENVEPQQEEDYNEVLYM